MSLLVIGLSHQSAPLELLERVALDGGGADALATGVIGADDITEAVILSTCNRTEVYAEAMTFHGAVAQVGEALAQVTGVPVGELTDYLYVHYEDRAVDHLFSLACGLESMALGESEVLAQLREALASGQRRAHLGRVLNPLFQQALRVGKRAHTDTGLDRVARSLVSTGVERARAAMGPLQGTRALVIGAGAMSGLAAATLARAGADGLTVVNRTASRAERLAAAHGGDAADWADLATQVASADLVLTCTGSLGHVLTADLLTARAQRPLLVIDLAMPRDVDPAVAELPGVTVWSLTELRAFLEESSPETEEVVESVRTLVTGEVAAYLATRRAQQVAPALAVLRSRAAAVAEAELDRLDQRLPDLPPAHRAEVHQSVRRVLDKVLHTPTVRAKALAAGDHDGAYVAMLRELFDLDARDTAAVARPPNVGGLP